MPDPSPAIETRGLEKVYVTGFLRRRSRGLAPLDLRVERGEIFGFIGPNGAGKTTTLKCLTGLQAPTAGEAFLLGRSIRDPRSRRHLGFLPERPYFYMHLTALEFLDFYAQLFDIPRPVRRRRCPELLDRVGLGDHRDTVLGTFSKGMLQRAGLAQALVNEPELIILDEPMSGLDPLGRMLVRDLILEQRRRGRTVFFSSHILSDVQSICDRVALVAEGRLRAVGPMGELVHRQVRHLECTVELDPQHELSGEEITRQGRERVVRVSPAHLDAFLDEARAVGARIRQVQPARMDLETVFLEELQLGEQPPGEEE